MSCMPKYRHWAPLITDNLKGNEQPLEEMTMCLFPGM